jgi:heparan-alpha-glucosaminide N-acetyltransferase
MTAGINPTKLVGENSLPQRSLKRQSQRLHGAATKLASTSPESFGTPKARFGSVDAYRGFLMLLVLAEVLRPCAVAAAIPDSRAWGLICYQASHVPWVGCSLADLVQPGFYFLVGVALLLSIKRRLSSDQNVAAIARHTIARSLILVLFGMVLVAIAQRQWTWFFAETLTQIGLAYPFVFLVSLRSKRFWFLSLGVILIGYWLWFALFPLLPMDYDRMGLPPEWANPYGLTGFAAHWRKNTNVSAEFDRWFLNLFPADSRYTGNAAGLTTLNFIPSIGTMILGLIAGDVLLSPRSPWQRIARLSAGGFLLLCSGWTLGALGVCPVVKAIWTPSWVLFSGGWCYLFLASFYALVDLGGRTSAVFPLTVIGTNAILAYTMARVYPTVAYNSLRRLVGSSPFKLLGEAYEPVLYGCMVLIVYWLILFSLHRRRIFLRI